MSLYRKLLLQRKRDIFVAIRDCRENRDATTPSPSAYDTRRTLEDDGLESLELNLIDELNQIAKVLEPEMPQPPRCDPTEKLPFDLVADIIGLSTLGLADDYVTDAEINLELLLPLTLVSTRWQWVILNSPHLWTHIDFDDYNDEADADSKLSLALALARDAPLTISISVETLTTEARSTIRSISHRIRTVHLNSCAVESDSESETSEEEDDDEDEDEDEDEEEDNIPRLIKELIGIAYYPILERITLGKPTELQSVILANLTATSPKLRLLKHLRGGVEMDTESLGLVTMEELEYARSSTDTADRLNSILSLCRSVQIVEEDDLSDADSQTFLPAENEPLRLTKFKYRGFGTVASSFVARLREIVRLDISLSAKDLLDFAQILSGLTNLTELLLVLKCSVDDDAVRGWDPQASRTFAPNRNLTRLRFGMSPDWQSLGSMAAATFDLQVASLMGRIVPNIRSLSLSPAESEQALLEWAGGKHFTQLISLAYWLEKGGLKMPREQMLSSTIQSLSVRISESSPHIRLAHYVQTLEVSCVVDEEDGTVPDPLGIEAFLYLQELNIAVSRRFEWSTFRNSPLRQLVLSGSDEEACTRFCTQLARTPDILPHLYSLTFQDAVEIDFLFIALEERNIRARKVSRIRELTLSGPPSSRYFAPLRDLLAGILSQRPSNYELSLLGNLEEYNDRDIPGCKYCHKELRYCDEPIDLEELGPVKNIPHPEAIYPARIKDIFTTRKSRYRLWLQASISRRPQCNDFEPWTTRGDSIEAPPE